MKIKLINPNTTQRMTEAMGRCAREVANAGTAVVAVSPTMGPPSIESHYDDALAVPGLLAEIAAGERDGFDGYVIACFGDPGLYAAREIARGPVIGIAEAAMHAASVLAPGFSVVTTLSRARAAWPGTWPSATACSVSVATCAPPTWPCSNSTGPAPRRAA